MLQRGTTEHYVDAALYDYEYRRRRADVRCYRRLAAQTQGPILEIGCGTGRIAAPLARDGHQVIGVDLSLSMLRRALQRRERLPRVARPRLQLLQGSFYQLPLRSRFALVIAAFNTLQHVYQADALSTLLLKLRQLLAPGGLLAFDVLNPDLSWLVRDPERRWSKTRFRHPVTDERLVYTTNHQYDVATQLTAITIYYDPAPDQPGKSERVQLCHRQYYPAELRFIVEKSGLCVVHHGGDFDGNALDEHAESQLVICCRDTDRSAAERQLQRVFPYDDKRPSRR